MPELLMSARWLAALQGGVLGGEMMVWIECPYLHWIQVWTTHKLTDEHVGKHAKMQRSKESQMGGAKQAWQAYQHQTG